MTKTNLTTLLNNPGPIPRILYLFGRPPLFTSRFAPGGLKDNLPVESPKGERFRLKIDEGHLRVFSEKPLFQAPLLKAKSLAGVKAFLADLELDPRPLATAKAVYDSVHRGKPLPNTSRFNFKRGLF